MKKLLFLLYLLCSSFNTIFGQAVTTVPTLPYGDQEITIIVDVKQAKDTRAKNLLGKTSDVYLWSGASDTETGTAFKYEPSFQKSFSTAYEQSKMTSLGNDKWSIKLKPRDFFAVPSQSTIKRMGLLLKNGNGSAQTEDYIITIYEKKLNVAFIEPQSSNFFSDALSTINVLGVSSEKAQLDILVNDTKVKSITNKDSITYQFQTGTANQSTTVKLVATTATETASTTFTVTSKPIPVIESLPAGYKDGANYLSDSKIAFVLYAPKKDFVYLIGDFNDWKYTPNYLMKRTPDGDRYWIEISGLVNNQEYAYQYFVNGTLAVGDPYAEKILDPNNDKFISNTTYPNLKVLSEKANGIASVVQTAQTPYVWKNTNFKKPTQSNLVIYELHLRDFVATQSYKTLSDTLDYLKKLGVNCIELMPIQEFTGNDSWGYNPTYYFAPDKAYGTKNDLKAFIDKCHENGIAVVLDVVYNQADYEFPYVKMYWDNNINKPSSDSPFFNQDAPHPYSVFFDFNHENQVTKDYVIRANDFWIKEYNIDGYRFDLVKGFTQKKSTESTASNYDQSRVDILKNYYNKIRETSKDAYVILELFTDNTEEKTLTDLGMMVWSNQNYNARDIAKGNNANMNWMSYKDRGFTFPHSISYMESHDEERVVYDAVRNGKISTTDGVLERIKATAAIFMAVPGPKMIWQFGEIGYDISINDGGRTGKKPYKWEYLRDVNRAKLYKVFAELIKLKKSESIFQTTNFQTELAGLQKKVTLIEGNEKVIAVANLDVNDANIANIFPSTGKWYDYFSGEEITVTDLNTSILYKPAEFHIYSTKAYPKPEKGLTFFEKSPITALESIEKNIKFNVFPNPCTDHTEVTIDPKNTSSKTVNLIDLNGKKQYSTLLKPNVNSLKINTQKLSKGKYIIQVVQKNKVSSQKIIKK